MKISCALFPRLSVWFALFTLTRTVIGAELISANAGAASLSGASGEPSISGDGRYVVFSSLARLEAGDANGISDVYLKDRVTGALRRLSDQRGADHPAISANGRFVIFRSLDVFPKIRLVDLESIEPPRTVSYPFNNNSFRYADSGAISPDGTFVAFAFRPIPGPGFNNRTDPQLCVNTTTDADRFNSSESITSNFLLDTLGRSALTRDGNTFFLETNDGILPADTNGTGDIYKATRGSDFVVRLSATEGNLPESGSAYHPAMTADGGTVFFIARRRLRLSDTDGRATIYRSTSADGFATPAPIPTAVVPVALSPQATSDGQYLVFLGISEIGVLRPYALRVSSGAVLPIAPSSAGAGSPPVISADNGIVAFALNESRAVNDTNGTGDVYVIANPFAGARAARPIVTLTGATNGGVITEGSGLNLSGTASSTRGIFFTAIEVDGQVVAQSSGASVQGFVPLARGIHKIRAVALDVANVPGQSATAVVTAIPVANTLRITGLTALQRVPRSDGSTTLNASFRLDNRLASATGPLRIVLAEIPDAAAWENFGNAGSVPAEPEQLITLLDLPSLSGGGATTTALRATVQPPTTLGDGLQGTGSTVVARLQEQVGGVWQARDQISVDEIRPQLNEETPGPNGGIPVLSANTSGVAFNPSVLQSIQIQGSSPVVERTRQTYSASAIFNTGTQTCRPAWSLVGGGSAATISTLGVLTIGELTTQLTLGVKATFGGRSQTLPVTILPVSPVVSVISAVPRAFEGGSAGLFKIVRSPIKSTPLTVAYRVTGSAAPGQDYTALSGTAVIPAGESTVRLAVTPLNDADIEGRERVTLTILPSARYVRSSGVTASVVIEDDEPGQPDATIQASGGPEIGAFQYDFDSAQQRAFLRGSVNVPSVFICRFVNRNPAAQQFNLTGGTDFLGFTVRYFAGTTDVTAQIAAGTFTLNNVQPNAGIVLRLRITPTAGTPLGGTIRCPILLNANGRNDVVEASVRRIR